MPGQPSRFAPTSQMVADLTKVAESPLETLRGIADTLRREPGILSPRRLYDIVGSVCSDAALARAVGNTVYSLPPDDPDRIVTWLKEVQAKLPARAPKLSDSVLAALRDRLAVLAIRYPAVERLRKAEGLRTTIGNWFHSVELLCDLRPLFDENRAQVEGLIPLQLLQIGYIDQNGNHAVFEVGLGSDDAEQLVEKLRLGKQKIAALKQACDMWIPHGWAALDDESPSDTAR